MNYRRLRIASAVALLVALSACGGNATPTATVAPTAAPTEAEVAPTETEVEVVVTEEAAATEAPTEAADVEGTSEATEASEETTETETEAEAVEGVTALATFANVARSGPGTGFDQVASIAVGTRLPVIGRNDSNDRWYLVTLESGESAWVWSRVVRIEPNGAEVEVAATIPAP